MKKLLALLMAALLVLSFAACGEKPADDKLVIGYNPTGYTTKYDGKYAGLQGGDSWGKTTEVSIGSGENKKILVNNHYLNYFLY